jgi:signal transduction histidine kinase
MFRLLLAGTYGAILALALACAGVAWWGSSNATFQFRRTQLADDVLLEHLRLRITAGTLLRYAAIGGLSERADPFDAEAAQQRLAEHFTTLRNLVAAEVALLPNDTGEREELEALAALEREAYAVVDRLRQAAAYYRTGQLEQGRMLLREALVDGFGERFRAAVDAAVAEEREEVEDARQRALEAMALVAALSKFGAAAALLVAGLALTVLLRRLQQPLDRLAEAASAVAGGDLSRRIEPASPRDEFGRVAIGFNAMVEEVARSRAALERHRDELEGAVVQRTAELARANATLRRGDDARRRFLADVSHELRTPLTIIRGEAEIALRGAERPSADYRQSLARIVEEAAHTARLVDDLLFVARSEAGEARVASQAVAFDEVVRRSVVAARTLAEARGVSVAERVAADRAVVQGDADRLRQLVLILLDNAVRYSDPAGEVTVTLAAAPDGIQLTVADRGMGIAPDEIERVFERFYRGDGAAGRHEGGSGLGLPLARAIARAHGGELTLESRLGEGTTARLVLPVTQRLQAVA